MTDKDIVLEPSSGTGMLAIFTEMAGSHFYLNEYAELRKSLVERLFPQADVTGFDALQIDDRLPPHIRPTVVIMNPPFSSSLHVQRKMPDTTFKHVNAALTRLVEGGRLVTITGANFAPSGSRGDEWRILSDKASLVLSVSLSGKIYARHGTTVSTRLSVFDKMVGLDDPIIAEADNVENLLDILGSLPCRQPLLGEPATVSNNVFSLKNNHRQAASAAAPKQTVATPKHHGKMSREERDDVIELDYQTIDWQPPARSGSASLLIYEPYQLQSIIIPDAKPHPDKIVHSVAMASVAPPKPSYHPHLYRQILDNGLLSDVQLESIIYAGEAHSHFLPGHWLFDKDHERLLPATDDDAQARQLRQGYQLGDGTGVGKGRQAAGIILDNWLKGRRKALWVSKSESLLEDARRDWSALLGEPLLITPLSRFPYGMPVHLTEGILYSTYSTLRSEQKTSDERRLQQVLDWFGADYDGAIILDESHALANAAPIKTEFGEAKASQQGRVGLLLQRLLPNARIVYLSATGATDIVNLAYAERLGLWGNANFPFHSRVEFVTMLDGAGVAAKEVFARDLKMLGLYNARSLSYEGVEYEALDHQLTPRQIEIYDSYAGAFEIIHNNLDKALEATNITSGGASLAANAVACARSAFESTKQRFFNHLITAMVTPSLIASVKEKLEQGFAPVIQLISTGEAVQERHLAEIPASQWNDLQLDVTPREYVVQYLKHAFPIQLHETYEDENRELRSRPVYDGHGNAVLNREAVKLRDRLILDIASLPAVPCALDQIVQHFGTEKVAEVTGRKRRIIFENDVYKVQSRPAASSLAETDAFMDGKKDILVFSEAGGTGRSYHAGKDAGNRKRRYHYLLEPGWRADVAIQGLGRTHRTNQLHPPVFAPVVSNVKAQKRFLSTISRRLDTLGAISKGQRQTAGQGLFRPEDNLESTYAKSALHQLYLLIAEDKIAGCPYQTFKNMTGLSLRSETGIKQELPRIQTFLNRLLALKIDMQNLLFAEFEKLIAARIEQAMAAGTYDIGTEVMYGDGFRVLEEEVYRQDPRSGALTKVLTIERKIRNRAIPLDRILIQHNELTTKLMVNERSGHAALMTSAPAIMADNGDIEQRVMLQRPLTREYFLTTKFAETHWQPVSTSNFKRAWQREIAAIPEFAIDKFKFVTGLLLPIWKSLPNGDQKVFLITTENNQRIVGRRVPIHWGIHPEDATIDLPPEQIFAEIRCGNLKLTLTDELAVARVLFMGEHRIEVANFLPSQRDQLVSFGLFSEIKGFQLRLFIPNEDDGANIFQKLVRAYPIISIVAKGC